MWPRIHSPHTPQGPVPANTNRGPTVTQSSPSYLPNARPAGEAPFRSNSGRGSFDRQVNQHTPPPLYAISNPAYIRHQQILALEKREEDLRGKRQKAALTMAAGGLCGVAGAGVSLAVPPVGLAIAGFGLALASAAGYKVLKHSREIKKTVKQRQKLEAEAARQGSFV